MLMVNDHDAVKRKAEQCKQIPKKKQEKRVNDQTKNAK
jgi:hypothetical protein